MLPPQPISESISSILIQIRFFILTTTQNYSSRLRSQNYSQLPPHYTASSQHTPLKQRFFPLQKSTKMELSMATSIWLAEATPPLKAAISKNSHKPSKKKASNTFPEKSSPTTPSFNHQHCRLTENGKISSKLMLRNTAP